MIRHKHIIVPLYYIHWTTQGCMPLYKHIGVVPSTWTILIQIQFFNFSHAEIEELSADSWKYYDAIMLLLCLLYTSSLANINWKRGIITFKPPLLPRIQGCIYIYIYTIVCGSKVPHAPYMAYATEVSIAESGVYVWQIIQHRKRWIRRSNLSWYSLMTWCTYPMNETLVDQQLFLYQLHHRHQGRRQLFRSGGAVASSPGHSQIVYLAPMEKNWFFSTAAR